MNIKEVMRVIQGDIEAARALAPRHEKYCMGLLDAYYRAQRLLSEVLDEMGEEPPVNDVTIGVLDWQEGQGCCLI